MKKYVLMVCLFLFVQQILFAQVRIGARASISFTNITNAHSISETRTGFQVAAFGLIPVDNRDMLFFAPEINYSAQGEYNVHDPKFTPGYPNYVDIKTFTSFINVPLFGRVYISPSDNEFYFEGGPYVGFKIGENIDRIEGTEPFDEEFSSFDFGLGVGFGYSINRKVEISARYCYGFIDQVKADAADMNNSNSILNFGVSYIFN